MITSYEILEKAGLKSGKTLTRWHQCGLIPPPEIGTHPNGRGKISYWDDWVLGHCLRIRQLVDSGYSLDRARETLGTDWEKLEARYSHRYKFKEISQRLDREHCLISLEDLVWYKMAAGLRIWSNEKTLTKKLHALLRHQADDILELVRGGFSPMLVIDGDRMAVMADFMVSVFIAARSPGSAAVMVVPMHREILDAFSELKAKMPRVPKVKPLARVRVDGRGKAIEREFRTVGQTDFEIIIE